MSVVDPEPRDCVLCSPEPPTVPGCVLVECADCRLEVWAAPSSLELAAQGVLIVCIGCGLARIAVDDDPRMVPPTPRQRAEAYMHEPRRGRRRRRQP